MLEICLRRGRLACLLAASVSLSGCVSSRIEQSRDATTGIAEGEAMVLLGRASYNEKQTEESFTECIADALNQGSNPIRLIPQEQFKDCLLYTSPSPRDKRQSRMPSSA